MNKDPLYYYINEKLKLKELRKNIKNLYVLTKNKLKLRELSLEKLKKYFYESFIKKAHFELFGITYYLKVIKMG